MRSVAYGNHTQCPIEWSQVRTRTAPPASGAAPTPSRPAPTATRQTRRRAGQKEPDPCPTTSPPRSAPSSPATGPLDSLGPPATPSPASPAEPSSLLAPRPPPPSGWPPPSAPGTLVGAQDASPSASPSGAATTTGGTTTTSCVALTPELTEGPYYVEEALVRRDITDDREGLPLALTINVIDTVSCEPLADAAVEIWHCDARGYYSGVSGNNPGSDSSAEEVAAAAASMFLRGVQLTDADGAVTFDTIYPGWYMGRTVHIHMKVHVGGTTDADDTYAGGTTAHTGQLFFDDAISDAVFQTDAYANRPEDERTENSEDNILGDHGDDPEFLVAITQLGLQRHQRPASPAPSRSASTRPPSRARAASAVRVVIPTVRAGRAARRRPVTPRAPAPAHHRPRRRSVRGRRGHRHGRTMRWPCRPLAGPSWSWAVRSQHAGRWDGVIRVKTGP